MEKSLAVALAVACVVAFAPSASASKVEDPFKIKADIPVVKQKDHVRQEPKKIEVEPAPPIENITKEGDTLDLIAKTHKTTWQRIWQKNLQLTNPDIINVGDKLIIPTASEILAERPLPAPVTPATSGGVAQPHRAAIPGNSYAPGNCTEYVKNRRPDIGNFWGDASQWGYSARAAGYIVNGTPSVGSIGVALAYGHVVYVEGVNGNGTVNISEQNYEGFGIVSSRTAPIGEFEYIH